VERLHGPALLVGRKLDSPEGACFNFPDFRQINTKTTEIMPELPMYNNKFLKYIFYKKKRFF